jgi:hypothetical protein
MGGSVRLIGLAFFIAFIVFLDWLRGDFGCHAAARFLTGAYCETVKK